MSYVTKMTVQGVRSTVCLCSSSSNTIVYTESLVDAEGARGARCWLLIEALQKLEVLRWDAYPAPGGSKEVAGAAVEDHGHEARLARP